MEQLRELTTKQKARFISFAIVVVYLLCGVLAYVWEVRTQTPQIEYVDGMQIDGSDFSPIANLFVAGTNGLVSFFTMLLSVAAMFVIALILLVPWRCIAIRKQSLVTEIEWKTTRCILVGFAILSVGVSLIMLRFTNLIFVLLITGMLMFLIGILGVLPMRNAYFRRKCSHGDDMPMKKQHGEIYNSEENIAVIKASICNGEQVAGFKDKKTGKFTEVMLIRSEKDLEEFKKRYGVEDVKKEY